MKTAIYSLHLRLFLMTIVVLSIAIGAVALFSSRESAALLRQYAASDAVSGLNSTRDVLAEYYINHGNWNGVQPFLEQTAKFSERQYILIDNQGESVGTSGGKLSGRDLSAASIEIKSGNIVELNWQEESSDTTDEHKDGKTTNVTRLRNTKVTTKINDAVMTSLTAADMLPVGTLYQLPAASPGAERNQVKFINSLNGSLFIAALFAVFAAVIATFLLSRRILIPVKQLTSAAQKLENGDFSRRVEITSKDEIGELSRAFNRMADSLVRTETLRRNLVSDVAHELRTPLTHIRCQLESIQDQLLEPNPETIDLLHAETMQLNRIIDDLQELALAESNQLSLNLQPVSVREEIDSVIYSLQAQTAGKKIILTGDISDNLPPVYADPNRVGQILRNLLNNAMTHTPAGGNIEVCARRLESFIEIAIIDTGAGIASEQLDKIFERFYRTDKSRERNTGGAGLGLAIVKGLVEMQGGQIKVESILNQGSSFIFTLPKFQTTIAKTCDNLKID